MTDEILLEATDLPDDEPTPEDLEAVKDLVPKENEFGFVPTGDPERDAELYAEAVLADLTIDPDEYREEEHERY